MTPGASAPVECTVDYLVEVCDVCEGKTIKSMAFVSQTLSCPGYYDMNDARALDGYSFTGAVSAPRQVRLGGYITWRDQFP